MKSLSVKLQLALAFAALTLIVLFVALAATYALSESDRAFSTYVNQSARLQGLAVTVRANAYRRALAVRNIVLVKTPADRDAEAADLGVANSLLKTALSELQSRVAADPATSARERTLLGEITRVEDAYEPVAAAIEHLALAGRTDDAIAKMNADCRPLLIALRHATTAYADFRGDMARHGVEAAETRYVATRNALLATCAAAVAIAMVMGFVITRRLVAALGAEPRDLSDAARRVADGDLSPVAGAASAPERSVLASMGAMQRQLMALIGQVRTSADGIATASAQIATGNADLSSRTEQQASALQQTAASMHQMTDTVRATAESAQQANALSGSAAAAAAEGGRVVDEVVATMRDITASSRRIGDIIGVIDGIAFQTNILALNAAVEAARAGEQGRGFAVVASEVRNLAKRSADAAKEIKSLISDSVARVEAGSELVGRAGDRMGDIVRQVRSVNDLLVEISTAATQQTGGIAQVNQAVGSLDQGTQQNAALVEESAAAAESLRQQAHGLTQVIAAFRLPVDAAVRH